MLELDIVQESKSGTDHMVRRVVVIYRTLLSLFTSPVVFLISKMKQLKWIVLRQGERSVLRLIPAWKWQNFSWTLGLVLYDVVCRRQIHAVKDVLRESSRGHPRWCSAVSMLGISGRCNTSFWTRRSCHVENLLEFGLLDSIKLFEVLSIQCPPRLTSGEQRRDDNGAENNKFSSDVESVVESFEGPNEQI